MQKGSRSLSHLFADDLDDLRGSRRKPRKPPRPVNDILADMRREQRRLEQRDSLVQPVEEQVPPWLLSAPRPLSMTSLADEADVYDQLAHLSLAAGQSHSPPLEVAALPARRAPSGPPPPRSWLARQSAASTARGASSSAAFSSRNSTLARLLFTERFLPHLYSSHASSRNSTPERLALICLRMLLPQLLSSEEQLEALAELPMHLREAVVWLLVCEEEGVKEQWFGTLLWDARDWENDDNDGNDSNDENEEGGTPPTLLPPNDNNNDNDDWDRDSSSEQGWKTLLLQHSHLSLATLRLLLGPTATSGTPSPVQALSLAFATSHLPSFSSVLSILPLGLRALSLAGVRFFSEPAGLGTPREREQRIIPLLRKLARATLILQFLDLSFTSPALTARQLASLPWLATDPAVTCWPALETLVARGLAPEGEGVEDNAERVIRAGLKGRRGGVWMELVLD